MANIAVYFPLVPMDGIQAKLKSTIPNPDFQGRLALHIWKINAIQSPYLYFVWLALHQTKLNIVNPVDSTVKDEPTTLPF